MSDKPESNGKGTAANITDQERDLAQQALAEYEKKNYKTCLEHLRRLEEARPNDPKVLHNKAVVEFYESGLCTADKFQKSIIDVCKQVIYYNMSYIPILNWYNLAHFLFQCVNVYRWN